MKIGTVSGVLILNRYTLGVRRLTGALMVSASITSMNLRKILEYKIFMLSTAVHENDSDLKRKFEINKGFLKIFFLHSKPLLKVTESFNSQELEQSIFL